MDADAGATTTRSAGPARPAGSLEAASAFIRAAGLVVDEVTASRVTGHLQLSQEHHTPWGIVHGGVYTTAIESAASIGASSAVRDQGQVAVGLTNTTHFLRSLTAGRVEVEAVALSQGRTQQLWRVDITDESGGSSPTARSACRTSRADKRRRRRTGLSQPARPGLVRRAALG